MTIERRTAMQSAATATGNGTPMNLTGVTTVAVQVSGTFSATTTFEASVDGANWVAIYGLRCATLARVNATTATGLFLFSVPGFRLFRARVSSYSSGSVTVTGIGVASTPVFPNNHNTDAPADAGSNSLVGIIGTTRPHTFNESSWDRFRGNVEATLLASAARTATTTSGDQTNYNHRGLILVVDVTARAAATTLTPLLQVKDPVSGTYDLMWQAAAAIDSADATITYYLYPGAGTSADFTEEADLALPRTWRLYMTHSDTDSITYSVGAALIL
jgi:hypothetical protein